MLKNALIEKSFRVFFYVKSMGEKHMLSPADVLQLQQLIEAEREKSQTILGARIGDIVKKQFPGVRVKSEFGSIRNLIKKHLTTLLEFNAKHGKDDEYVFSLATHAASNEQTCSGTVFEDVSTKNKNNVLAQQVVVVPGQRLHDENQLQLTPDEILRHAIKTSLDMMTSEQLRQLALPAGILFDAISKASRV